MVILLPFEEPLRVHLPPCEEKELRARQRSNRDAARIIEEQEDKCEYGGLEYL